MITWSMTVNYKIWYYMPERWRLTSLDSMWNIGKWSLGSNISGYIYNRASTWLTLILLGPSSVAVLELGRQLVTVIQSFIAAMANYWQPILAKLSGKESFDVYLNKMWRITFIQSIVGAAILVIALLVMPLFIQLVVVDNLDAYIVSIPIAWCFAGAMIAQLMWQHPNYTLTVFERPAYGFYAKLVSALVALPTGYLLTFYYGVIGASLAATFGEIVVLIVVLMWLRYLIKTKYSEDSVSAG